MKRVVKLPLVAGVVVRGVLRHPLALQAITVRSDVGDVFVEGR